MAEIDEAAQRLRAGAPFVVVGGAAIVLGGLVAAVTGPLQLTHGSWLAAFLVLVVGVAQIVLGAGAWLLPGRPPPRRAAWVSALTWTMASSGVVAGTLLSQFWLVALGCLGVLVALWRFDRRVATADATDGQQGQTGWTLGYRALVWLLAISGLVGLVLSATRQGVVG